ncbi:MAG: metal-dependent hydrolase [Bacteroidetes bacterium ADurb.Bin397]|nr:MAG: metal-dependent hydrolase [Bacteroidetes bacterium ADurb.Bin397]
MNISKGRVPQKPLVSVKSPLIHRTDSKPSLIWFGHSSYFISIEGQSVLVDPVLSGHASPFSFMVKAFPGSDIYKPTDFGVIDLLVLTHDHYDHLDYKTLFALKGKVKHVVCSLGVASHLIFWGYDKAIITELDWWQWTNVGSLKITATPARHFSGRLFKRAQTLWSSFVLQSSTSTIYIGGDSGYDSHFKEIANRFGSFDLALLECGQYNSKWPLIHMTPEESVQAGIDLQAKVIMPVHFGKFALAFHDWNEPVKRFVARCKALNIAYTTPMIGDMILADGKHRMHEAWYE